MWHSLITEPFCFFVLEWLLMLKKAKPYFLGSKTPVPHSPILLDDLKITHWFCEARCKARGCSTNSFVIKSASVRFPPTTLQCRHAQTVREISSRYKRDYIVLKSFIKPKKASKSHKWFNSYGCFTKEVDFAYWWSFIMKGLRLKPAQQACWKIYSLV